MVRRRISEGIPSSNLMETRVINSVSKSEYMISQSDYLEQVRVVVHYNES